MSSIKIIMLAFTVMLAAITGEQVVAQDMPQSQEEISGTVVDATTGTALAGVEITLERGASGAAMPSQAEGDPQTREADSFETNDEGEFTAEKPENGTYTLTVEHEGYETWAQTIRVTANGIMVGDTEAEEEIEISLQPSV